MTDTATDVRYGLEQLSAFIGIRTHWVVREFGLFQCLAIDNARCNSSIAAKNVSAANNGFTQIRAVIRASVIVPKSAAKRRGKQPRKGAGCLKIQAIGAVLTASKKPNSGASQIHGDPKHKITQNRPRSESPNRVGSGFRRS